ncbi:hypothetical protein G6O69_04515 [Pseudenhygromyxa sp. WMMC2535]|uniref:hypothetical protein n=1 Tax=Pseudenhygromyxa sp. WMMC2535 TaxID=2712867 RepID=UPI0015581BC3|nr:hypothetical protein [Pseudenhygromyxa sp. WMMC2535]NVB37081.1 hypothetical protein [Pseudenhygromyxa sp. WMMC2535]
MSTTQTPQQQVWAELYERFDPERPAREKDWRVARDYSPAREISRELARPMGGHKRFMLLGGLGSGKSTELFGIAEERSAAGPVVFVDLVHHFEERVNDPAALQRVQPWEVLLVIGLAVLEAGRTCFGHEWSRALIQRFDAIGRQFEGADDDGPSFDAAKLAAAVAVLAGGALAAAGGPVGIGVGAGLVAMGQAGGAVQWRFKLATPGRAKRSDQDRDVQSLLGVVNSLIGELQAYGCKLTLFVDGLDRIDDRERIRALFVESALLGGLSCDVVLTGPIALHWGSLRKHVRKFTTKMLTNAPVVDREDPWRWEPGGRGIDICVEVYRRRSEDLSPTLIPEALLRKLAYYSGGRMREFVKLIRELTGPAWDRSLEQADEAVVEHAIETMREVSEGGLTSGHLKILRQLLDDPSQLPNDELVAEMLDLCMILPYPNESEWYLPHPLLLKVKLPKIGG